MDLRRPVATAVPVVLTAALITAAVQPGGGPAVDRLVTAAAHSAPALPADDPLPVHAAAATADGGVVLPAPGAPEPVTSLAVTTVTGVDASGIPARVRAAYEAAAAAAPAGCRVPWQLLAGVGRIESDHGRYAGAVVGDDGRVQPGILGPPLDGSGPFAVIADTDAGTLDGDVAFDRAVGPMQFLPGTWATWGADADGDGVADPQDVDDAALAAARYLCAAGGRLDRPAGRVAAVFAYNHSDEYVRAVLTVAAGYAGVDPGRYGTALLPPPVAAAPSPVPSTDPAAVPVVAAPEAAVAAPTPAPAPTAAAPPTAAAATAPVVPAPTTSAPEPTPSEEPTPEPTDTATPSAEPTPSQTPTEPPAG